MTETRIFGSPRQRPAVARTMLGRGGKIINIASMLSFQGGIRVASYAASKSGLAGITRLLANEYASRAKACLNGHTSSEFGRALFAVPDFILDREH